MNPAQGDFTGWLLRIEAGNDRVCSTRIIGNFISNITTDMLEKICGKGCVTCALACA